MEKISLENGHVLGKNRDLKFKIDTWYKIPIFHYGLAYASLFCMGNKLEISSFRSNIQYTIINNIHVYYLKPNKQVNCKGAPQGRIQD